MIMEQSAYLYNLKIELLNDMIEYNLVNEKETVKSFISYEEITNDIVKFERSNPYTLLTGLGLLSLFVMSGLVVNIQDLPYMMYWIAISGIISISHHFKYKVKFLGIISERFTIIFLNNEQGSLLSKELLEKKNNYLKEKHFKINWENDQTTELNRFLLLQQRGVISQTEFEETKRKLLTL